ncbi:MAG: hypothetical protein COT74_03260 [Bdellovibrionales bacterium CG10_big_fil_rev_8_21_14_0_10_45_34]|nr:MAG: hypothetical protein COT74_03260 [Bdellovibrionales bacterium CG10_big_fil_rev_8_21_14_0_10_45_34]
MSSNESSWRTIPFYYLPLLLYSSYYLGLKFGGLWSFAAFATIFIVIPIVDPLFGEFDFPSARKSRNSRLSDFVFAAAPATIVLAHILAILLTVSAVNTKNLYELLGLSLSLGTLGSLVINASHELVHKVGIVEKWFGRIGLVITGYPHFEISHIYGHHALACTKADNSTGWRDESIYSYLRRTLPSCLRFAYEHERRRVTQYEGFFRRICMNNFVTLWLITFLFILSLVIFGGLTALIVFVVQAVIAVILLETVSYIEHYGLLRKKQGSRYESMKLNHSWDSGNRLSNWLLFNLQIHSEHHKAATKRYQNLHLNDVAPKLPYGYPTLVGVTFIPVLWHNLIHPILDKFLKQIEEQQRISPPLSQSSASSRAPLTERPELSI